VAKPAGGRQAALYRIAKRLYDQEGIVKLIDVEKIDPSPFQQRKYIDEDKLRELAMSIRRDGLIEPIVIRPLNGRYQLIAGERRWRAVRDYTDLKTIEAKVKPANDLEAMRIAFTENLQREDLSAIEIVESTVLLVDIELIHDKEYAAMGKEPVDRVNKLLGSLHSIANSKNRGSQISKKSELLLNKFVQQLNKIFKNLPKPLEWRSFYNHDLPLITDFCEDIQGVSIRHQLNRSQTRALKKPIKIKQCRYRSRALSAGVKLKRTGFKNVYVLRGGLICRR